MTSKHQHNNILNILTKLTTLKNTHNNLFIMNKKIRYLIGIAIFVAIILIALNTDYLSSIIKSKIISSNVENITGNAPEGTYPLILLHGFNPVHSQRISELALKEMQISLTRDLKYVDRGLLTEDTNCVELIYNEKPIIIRATYYETLEMQNVVDYSNNLKTIVDKIKYCTGAKKVDMVTHSMGGVTSLYYLKHLDNSSVRKLVMIASPIKGKFYNVPDIGSVLIEDGESVLNLDFLQLFSESNLIKDINIDIPQNIEYYTVAGNVDGKGDGLVLKDFVAINYNYNNHKEVKCGHILMKNPIFCPDAYEFVMESLTEE